MNISEIFEILYTVYIYNFGCICQYIQIQTKHKIQSVCTYDLCSVVIVFRTHLRGCSSTWLRMEMFCLGLILGRWL